MKNIWKDLDAKAKFEDFGKHKSVNCEMCSQEIEINEQFVDTPKGKYHLECLEEMSIRALLQTLEYDIEIMKEDI